MHILIIEDDPQNLYLASILLEAGGHSLRSCVEGIEGIEVAKTIKFDAILIDIQLPGIDGYEVATRLREIASIDDVCLVAVTSFAMAGDMEKALASGFDGYIEKPIDPDMFTETVNAMVAEKRS